MVGKMDHFLTIIRGFPNITGQAFWPTAWISRLPFHKWFSDCFGAVFSDILHVYIIVELNKNYYALTSL